MMHHHARAAGVPLPGDEGRRDRRKMKVDMNRIEIEVLGSRAALAAFTRA